ncbi:ABC transporter ATP-binding protein [Microbaculum marinum]|uniref:ABC transporter ATP-binding protein n=1 Tax=Microbaculum marinum TaxID=1764581 RepID=A0AAW9RRM1_9HYPH
MDLNADSITVRFGGLVATDGVTIRVRPRQIVGLIGPNGAGKTTLVNVLSGFQRPSAGRVRLGEEDLTGRARDGFARSGIVRTFQAVRLFRSMTVSENVEVGYVSRGIARGAARRKARELLAEFDLADKADLPATGLSYGQERRAGLARALAMEPRHLLLDEPAAGVAPAEADELAATIRGIRDRYGCGVLVIEHNMALVMSLCDHIHVLDTGRTIAAGTPDAIRADETVRSAYLGASAAR